MSATGLLALNFCDVLLLVTSYEPILKFSNFVASEFEVNEQITETYSYLTQISEIPHHVLVAYNDLYCSGSLIRSRIVVTAASCFTTLNPYTTVVVKVGSSTMTEFGQIIEVLEVKKHEYFGHITDLDNDIALLMLKDHVEFSENVMKIPVKEKQENLQDSNFFKVCGWGSTNLDTQYKNGLLCTDMKVVNNTECGHLYGTYLSKANFCVEYEYKFRLSDNGGPALHKGQLVGLVSYGADRTKEPFIALITNVPFFNRWINVNVQRFLKKYCVPAPFLEEHYYTSKESEPPSSVEKYFNQGRL